MEAASAHPISGDDLVVVLNFKNKNNYLFVQCEEKIELMGNRIEQKRIEQKKRYMIDAIQKSSSIKISEN